MSNQAILPDLEALAAKWSLLDQVQEWSDFSQVNEQQIHQWTSSVVFEGMHCTACAINIEEALMSVPGVKSAQISAASHRGRVVWSSDQTQPSDWMKAVAKLGYRTVPANDALANELRREDARKMLWRLGVAWRTTKRLGVLLKAGSLKLELKLALNLLCSVHAFVKHIRRKQNQEKRKYPFEFFNG